MKDLSQIAHSILLEKLEEKELSVLCARVHSEEFAQRLLELILAGQSPGVTTSQQSVSKTMQLLEGIADTSPETGCMLMLHLWPIADRLFMHDICHSIDFWISSSNSTELKRQIQLAMDSEHDIYLKNHFVQLVK